MIIRIKRNFIERFCHIYSAAVKFFYMFSMA